LKRKGWRWLGLGAVVASAGTLTALRLRRKGHLRALRQLEVELAQPGEDVRFQPEMVAALPDPAKRYLLHAIAPGTRIARAVQLHMHGRIQLKRGADPVAFAAEQVTAHDGFVWRAEVRSGALRMSGFDRFAHDEGEMSWWVYDTVPVVSAKGASVSRSAAGRLAGESIFLPSNFLPLQGARWQAIDDTSSLVRMEIGVEQIDLTLSIDDDGRLVSLSMMRWNSDAANGPVGPLRFDVTELTEERTFDGYTIPTRLLAGWRLGKREAFPFFYASIDSASFL
jgi:Family of unknown function (DUF6544)